MMMLFDVVNKIINMHLFLGTLCVFSRSSSTPLYSANYLTKVICSNVYTVHCKANLLCYNVSPQAGINLLSYPQPREGYKHFTPTIL